MAVIRDKFVSFLVTRISEASGRNRNPVMARIIDSFCSSPAYVFKRKTIECIYAVNARVYLEKHGFIVYAPLNAKDRRIKPLCPTSKFPTRPEGIASLAERVSRAVQEKINDQGRNR